MPVVEDLIVRLRAEGGGKIDAATASVTGLLAALAGFVGVMASAADATIKAARSAGIAAEAYQELRFALGQAGVDEASFATAARAGNKALSEAAMGAGAAAEAYAQLGVSAKDAQGNTRTFADVLPDLLDGLARVPSEADRSRLSMVVLGRAGTQFASAIEAGGQALRDAADRARRYGIVMSKDALTASEEMNDALDDMKSMGMGVATQFFEGLIPAARDLVLAFRDLAESRIGPVLDGARRIGEALGSVLRALASPLGMVAAGIFAARGLAGLPALLSSMSSVAGPLGPLLGAVASRLTAAGAAAGAVAPWLLLLAVLDDIRGALNGEDSLLSAMAEVIGVEPEFKRFAEGIGGLLDEGALAAGRFADSIREALIGALDSLIAMMPSLEAAIAPIRDFFAAFSLGGVLDLAASGVDKARRGFAADREFSAAIDAGASVAEARAIARETARGGMSIATTFNITGVTDPKAIAAEVERAQQRTYAKAAAELP
jgi:hypothetical protein